MDVLVTFIATLRKSSNLAVLTIHRLYLPCLGNQSHFLAQKIKVTSGANVKNLFTLPTKQ